MLINKQLDNNMAIIRLTTCDDIIEVNFIKNNLENENIECFVTNEISSTLLPGFNGILNAGVQVMINDKDLVLATELINKDKTEKPLLCPNCNSTNIFFGFGKSKLKKYFLLVLSLLAFTPFNNLKGNYYCKDCKTNF